MPATPDALYEKIKDRVPDARVFILGHPRTVTPDDFGAFGRYGRCLADGRQRRRGSLPPNVDGQEVNAVVLDAAERGVGRPG